MKKGKFNLLVAIQQGITNRSFSPETLEVISRGKDVLPSDILPIGDILLPMESRDLTVASGGSELVGNQVLDLVSPLRAALVCVQAGATLLTGLKGEVKIPKYSGTTVLWEGETDEITEGSGTFEVITMNPKRITATIDISKMLLLQTSPSAEALLVIDIIDAISEKLEATIFGKAAHNVKYPDGLFTGINDAALQVKGAASWANTLSFESLLDNANVKRDTRAYITNGAGGKILKQTPKINGQAVYLYENGKCNEYPIHITNNIANGLATAGDENGLIFANWSDLIIGQWGPLDILVDPFTQSKAGKVRLIINSYWDVAKRRDESFAIGSLK